MDEATEEYLSGIYGKDYRPCEHCEGCAATQSGDCENECECGHEHEDDCDIHPERL